MSPTITVLTHGLGSKYYFWSNNYNVYNGKKLAYNSDSLVSKIYERLDGQMTLYVASTLKTGTDEEPRFKLLLKKYSYLEYLNSEDGDYR